jgi:hypothetical protein
MKFKIEIHACPGMDNDSHRFYVTQILKWIAQCIEGGADLGDIFFGYSNGHMATLFKDYSGISCVIERSARRS